MMDDILKQIEAGEVSGVQFKERALDKYDIGCELVAFSNARGGKLVVGVNDKTGKIICSFLTMLYTCCHTLV
jgi:ATP-dependent DNA helicase RecG